MGSEFRQTFIQHEDRTLTIWTGWDEDATYKVGDQISWWPKPERPGLGADAVYVSMSAGDACLVAVSGHKIAEIVKISDFKDSEDPLLAGHQALESRWPKSVPPKELWSDEVWMAQERRKSEIKRGMVRRST
mgnify:CR=1 FL=1